MSTPKPEKTAEEIIDEMVETAEYDIYTSNPESLSDEDLDTLIGNDRGRRITHINKESN